MIPLPDLIHELLFPSEATVAAFNIVFLILTIIAASVAWTFSITYGLFYPWRDNRSGRSAFYMVTALACVLSVIVLARWLGDYPGRILLTLTIYLAIPVTLIRLLVTLLRGWTHGSGTPHQRRAQVGRDFDRTLPRKRKVKP